MDNILKAAIEATSQLLPTKSKVKYEKSYAVFCQWRKNMNVNGVDENILIAYFFEKVNKNLNLVILFYNRQKL